MLPQDGQNPEATAGGLNIDECIFKLKLLRDDADLREYAIITEAITILQRMFSGPVFVGEMSTEMIKEMR